VKIESAISKTGQGVAITSKVGLALNEILAKARQMDELAGEIATASSEQADGISQINVAVAQMDKVTQSNAAHAEENAASSQELNAQAEIMKQSVMELLKLVGGQKRAPGGNRAGNGSGQPRISTVKIRRVESVTTPVAKRHAEIPVKNGFKDF